MDLRLDTNTGDLDMSLGTPQLVTGREAIAQKIRIRLRFFRGEWFLDTRLGVPYFESILKKNPNKNVVASLFQQVVLKTPGVTALKSFALSINKQTRVLSVTFEAATTDGDVVFDDLFLLSI